MDDVQHWPKWLFRQGGEGRIFDSAEDVPDDGTWLAYEDVFDGQGQPRETEAQAAAELSEKEQLVAALEARGVTVDKRMGVAKLKEALEALPPSPPPAPAA